MKVADDELLSAIRQHHAVYGYAPSLDEISRAVGLSRTAVYARLVKLERGGYIKHDRGRARSVVIVEPAAQ